MAVASAVASIVMTVASTAISISQQSASAGAAQAQARYQAQVAQQQAEYARMMGQYQMQLHAANAQQIRAQAQARYEEAAREREVLRQQTMRDAGSLLVQYTANGVVPLGAGDTILGSAGQSLGQLWADSAGKSEFQKWQADTARKDARYQADVEEAQGRLSLLQSGYDSKNSLDSANMTMFKAKTDQMNANYSIASSAVQGASSLIGDLNQFDKARKAYKASIDLNAPTR